VQLAVRVTDAAAGTDLVELETAAKLLVGRKI
jgi:hypothetical protein